MEGGDNILDALLEEDNLDDVDVDVDADDDVEMVDVEEGELVEEHGSQKNVSGEVGAAGGDVDEAEKKLNGKNRRRRANRKKNKRKRNGLGSEGFDINRFVLDTCRRLKEKKSYMVYTAVGCLGVSALSDLIKEVDAIQACGGQKTADGRRFRTGGGILWSIIKVRDPQAFKEIMKKAKEFEKQFRQPNVKQPPMQKKEESSQGVLFSFAMEKPGNVSDNTSPAAPQMQDQPEPSCSEEKRVAVHDRLRIPVTYDDDLLGSSVDNDAT